MSKTAVITGSTSGIGLSIAEAFAKEGYNIMFHGLEKNGAEIASEIGKKYSVQTSFSNANLIEAEQIQDLVDASFKTFGSVEVLINNAGIQYVSPIE